MAVCSFTVRVPVLSVAMTVQLPRLSTELSFLTITLFLLIRFEPIVRAMVSAKGRPSGIADTDKAITDKNISLPDVPFEYKTTVIIMAIATTKNVISFENFSILIVNGDLVSFVVFTF